MGFILVSPLNHRSLVSDGDFMKSLDGEESYPVLDGIPHLVRSDRVAAVEQFSARYGAVRAAEGRRSEGDAYYRALPYDDLSGRFVEQWRLRSATFDLLVDELGSEGLDIVDAGAGNCWLAARLTSLGHSVVAIDVNVDRDDGLGARNHYEEHFDVARGELGALPLSDRCADVVVFAASAHYQPLEVLIAEAGRVLKPGGRMIIADSPVYSDSKSGVAMVAEMERYINGLGVEPATYEGPGFLTDADLAESGLEWRRSEAGTGPFSGLRRRVAGLRVRRELARLPLLIATPSAYASTRSGVDSR